MYICICNAVTDKQIKRAIKDGAQTIKDLNQKLNVGSNCGSCVTSAQSILDTTIQSKPFNIPMYQPSFG
ncbi:MAG: bacterioferritin-associated ferredoxin [Marinicellaceae bacterium]